MSQRVNIRLTQEATNNDIELILAIWDMKKFNIAVCFAFPYDKNNSMIDRIK